MRQANRVRGEFEDVKVNVDINTLSVAVNDRLKTGEVAWGGDYGGFYSAFGDKPCHV